jgi:DNA-binding transcriptional ArsR family regulator
MRSDRGSVADGRTGGAAGSDGPLVAAGTDEDAVADAAETFGLLSDETRVQILVALAAASERALSFSDLRARVGVADSGQFNYHLDRLCGRLVARTGDGYALTETGAAVARLL